VLKIIFTIENVKLNIIKMSKIIIKNRKVFFDYEIIEKYLCGIVLLGSEVKSLKLNNVNITNSFCYINNGEIFIKDMNISLYKQGSQYNNHIPLRERKLLLKKKEIIKISDVLKQKGLTLIPIQILISDRGFIKIEIAICKGKNTYDKRNSLKLKDLDRELKQTI
jgi:SsrA-binding protein